MGDLGSGFADFLAAAAVVAAAFFAAPAAFSFTFLTGLFGSSRRFVIHRLMK